MRLIAIPVNFCEFANYLRYLQTFVNLRIIYEFADYLQIYRLFVDLQIICEFADYLQICELIYAIWFLKSAISGFRKLFADTNFTYNSLHRFFHLRCSWSFCSVEHLWPQYLQIVFFLSLFDFLTIVLALTVMLLLAYKIFSLINYFLFFLLFNHRVNTKDDIYKLTKTVLSYYKTEILTIY